MSILVIEQLFDGVVFDQPITIQRDTAIAHIRPWIMKFGTLLTGDLQIEVIQASTTLATKTINFSEIESAISDPYAHGFIRFDFDALNLRIGEGNTEETYTLRLKMINYTNNPTGYIALTRAWDVPIYENTDSPANDMVKAFGIEIYTYEN